jgi:hypothetical protein
MALSDKDLDRFRGITNNLVRALDSSENARREVDVKRTELANLEGRLKKDSHEEEEIRRVILIELMKLSSAEEVVQAILMLPRKLGRETLGAFFGRINQLGPDNKHVIILSHFIALALFDAIVKSEEPSL